MASSLDTHGHAHPEGLAHHFNDVEQQRYAAELGMWLFLITEFMFFGGLFLAYLMYRREYPDAFVAGSHAMDVVLGTINTAVLLTSSLTMVLAVQAAETRNAKTLVWTLLATVGLGAVFLGVKAYEYHHKYVERHIPFLGLEFSHKEDAGLKTFYNLYFVMTGFHALHMVIGMGILLVLAKWARDGRLVGEDRVIVGNVGLYWHFVDLVWVYLFPLFYLVGSRIGAGGH